MIGWPAEVASTLNAHFGDKQGLEDQHAMGGAAMFVPDIAFAQNQRDEIRTMDVAAKQQTYVVHGTQDPDVSDIAHPLAAKNGGRVNVLAGDLYNGTLDENTAATLPAHSGGIGPKVVSPLGVRRLTPLECERLMGFPDNYTNIPGTSDSARYTALGNSMPVPVMRWIGGRIK